jgi:hypothetical protein
MKSFVASGQNCIRSATMCMERLVGRGHRRMPVLNESTENKGRFTHSMPRPFRPSAMPCREGFRMCLSHLIYTVRPCLIHTCHAIPDHAVLLKATAQHGHRERACGQTARVRLLPTITRSSAKLSSDAYQLQMPVASVKPNTVCHGRGKEC